MQFVIDENIPAELRRWLESKGHQIYTITKGSPDEEVAAAAKKTGFPLLTLDRHFANTIRFPPKEFPGIIRIKIHPSYIEDIMFSLDRLFQIFPSTESLKNKLIILEKDGFFKIRE